MIPMPIMEALVKSGVLGAILVWALMQNAKLTDRSFKVLENNTKALLYVESAVTGKPIRKMDEEKVVSGE